MLLLLHLLLHMVFFIFLFFYLFFYLFVCFLFICLLTFLSSSSSFFLSLFTLPLSLPHHTLSPPPHLHPSSFIASPLSLCTLVVSQASFDIKQITTQLLHYSKQAIRQPLFYKVLCWLLVFWIFVKMEFGVVFVVVSAFALIYKNLGDRKQVIDDVITWCVLVVVLTFANIIGRTKCIQCI